MHGAISAAVLAALLAALPAVSTAQSLRLSGRVVRGADAVPAAGVWAVLHRVGRDGGGGPVDSTRTDGRGRYAVAHAPLDTSAIYLVSATFRDITYFSGGITPDAPPDSVELLVVFDTSSTAPPILVAERHIVVRTPGPDGARRVLELLVLANAGNVTRIAPDSLRPVWEGRLPAGAGGFETGESDVSAEAVFARGDSVFVAAPVPPGEKQVLYTYVLPGGAPELRLRLDQDHRQLTVLLEDTSAVAVSGGLASRGVQVFEDAQFAMYDAADVPAGTEVAFRFTGGGLSPVLVQGLLAGVVVAVLAGALIVWMRRSGPGADPDTLAAEIAALDRQFEARGEATPAERAAYHGRRAQLKARLEAALAERARSS